MLFFFKSKKIVLDAFTDQKIIYENFSIKKAINFMPDWWKNQNSFYETTNEYGIVEKHPTIKRCDGIIDLYKKGFIIPNWCDLTIKTTEDGGWAYRFASGDGRSNIFPHIKSQFDPNFNEYIVLKLMTPWLIFVKDNCRIHLQQTFWNHIDLYKDFIIPPGVVNFKHISQPNLNIMFLKKNKIYDFNAGLPLAHGVSLSHNDVEIKCHLVTKSELDEKERVSLFRPKFFGFYKQSNKDQEKKCPFGFGK